MDELETTEVVKTETVINHEEQNSETTREQNVAIKHEENASEITPEHNGETAQGLITTTTDVEIAEGVALSGEGQVVGEVI